MALNNEKLREKENAFQNISSHAKANRPALAVKNSGESRACYHLCIMDNTIIVSTAQKIVT